MSQSPRASTPASSDEVSQLRREMASMAAALRAAQEVQSDTTPTTGSNRVQGARGKVAENNRWVKSKRFSVEVGPGAEEAERFQKKWVALLKSHLAFDHTKDDLGRLIVHCINENNRDLQPQDRKIVAILLDVAKQLGKVKPTAPPELDDNSESESESESEEDETEPEVEAEPIDRAAAKAAAKAAALKWRQRELEKLAAAVDRVWDDMEEEEQNAYCDAILERDTPTERQLRTMLGKARSNFLYPMLKQKLREVAPELVPFTEDVKADAAVYKEAKRAFATSHSRTKWPRQCDLLFGRDAEGNPQFLYTEEGVTVEEDVDHPFTAYVSAVADACGIDEVKPGLVAFLTFIADQIASAEVRGKGRGSGKLVQGDLANHSLWNGGIQRALKFMKSRAKCPTRSPIVKRIQRK